MKWMYKAIGADYNAIAEKFNIDKVIARIIRNRDITTDEGIDLYLNGGMDKLHDPLLMKDMSKAVDILLDKIAQKKKIRIIGDYDVDGICSTYILLKGLKALGADADTVIPHRILDGYGLNDNLINQAHDDAVDTILTCDNGIAAYDQVKLAKEYGMTVVVTDHHEVPYNLVDDKKEYILPMSDAIVDPKQVDDEYPYKGICGAMIAFKLISVLVKDDEVIRELIPFAAMATVCDVMELLDENRIIVKAGLQLMKNPINKGLKALIIATGLDQKPLSAYHYGFVIGPTINATGRLDTAKRALELFACEDFNECCMIATTLRELNESRKKLTEDGTILACEIIDTTEIGNNDILVVYLKDCHESIAGIIAGRIKEKYYKPTIVLTDAEDGIKGSGRSIEAYDMYAELSKVSDLFTKFGGHKMAAGLSLPNEKAVDELRRRLNEASTLSKKDLERTINVEFPMPLSYVSFNLIKDLELLEPTGTANPKPIFADKEISLLSYEQRGKAKKIGKFKIMDQYDRIYEMVYFDDLDAFDLFITDRFGKEALDRLKCGRCTKNEIKIMIAYNPGINTFNNRESLQIVMKHYDAKEE